MAHIQLVGIDKAFAANQVLRGCSLAVEKRETVTLLGPSGCGKTTLLRVVGGFLAPDAGEVIVGGRDITWERPNRREVGFVFQNYALFPHLTVRRNVAYGLAVRRRPRAEVARRVDAALDLVSLTDFADPYPAQLSGGQQQRVAIARSLVLEPQVDLGIQQSDADIGVCLAPEVRSAGQLAAALSGYNVIQIGLAGPVVFADLLPAYAVWIGFQWEDCIGISADVGIMINVEPVECSNRIDVAFTGPPEGKKRSGQITSGDRVVAW